MLAASEPVSGVEVGDPQRDAVDLLRRERAGLEQAARVASGRQPAHHDAVLDVRQRGVRRRLARCADAEAVSVLLDRREPEVDVGRQPAVEAQTDHRPKSVSVEQEQLVDRVRVSLAGTADQVRGFAGFIGHKDHPIYLSAEPSHLSTARTTFSRWAAFA